MNTNLPSSLPESMQAMATPIDPSKPVHVIPYRHEEPLFWISVYFAVTMWALMLIFTLGLIIPIMLLLGLLGMFAHSLLIAWLKGNSVKVTAQQFPDLYALYQQCCTRLGMVPQPELYLAQSDGMLNAMATRFMRRDYVVLLSGVVEALADKPQAIKFYMGHELGHIKRKHLSRHWWLWPGMLYPLLSPAYSRAREYTCDRHGFACCDNLDDAKRALAVLVAGPELWKQLNLGAFEAQAQETGGFWMAVNELTADYPWLCKRMMVLENRNAVFPRRNFFAWMIALMSPRMGYGGAIIGFLYWLIIGAVILALVAALTFSGSKMSWPDTFGKNPIIKLWEKMLDIEPSETADSNSPQTSSNVADMTPDDVNFAIAYGQLSNTSQALDEYQLTNKNRLPTSLAVFKKDDNVDTQGITYEIISKDRAKELPDVQVLMTTSLACESCGAAPPVVQFRKDQAGNWTCHVAGISQEMLKKQYIECEPLP